MNRFGGQFASGMKQELAVGNSPAQFGSGGKRFTTLTLIFVSLSLSLSLAQSPSHTHSRSLTISLSLSLSLTRSQSPFHTHRRFGSRNSIVRWRFRRFRATPHPRAFPVGVAYLRRKLPPRPAPDAQIRSKRKIILKKKLARIRRIPTRFRRNSVGYRQNHC
jgi:hypothetical protein